MKLLPISPSETPKPSASTDALIREWLFRFGVEHKEDIGPKLPLWLEAFGGMDPATLEPLFKIALRSRRFFPKVSEILEPLQTVKEAALPEEASEAWQKVLSIRREHFNPDFPQYLVRAVAQLPERVQRATRASGVFQEVSDPDQLHTWVKKKFVESYSAWDEIEERQHLLPAGPIKSMLTAVAGLKSLHGATPDPEKRRRLLVERADDATSVVEGARSSEPYTPPKSCENNWKVDREELQRRQTQRVGEAGSMQLESPCLGKAQADAFVRSCIAKREGANRDGATGGGAEVSAKGFSQR